MMRDRFDLGVMRGLILALAALCAAGTLSLSAGEPPAAVREFRRHYFLRSVSGDEHYDVTVITQMGEERLSVVGLVLDQKGQRFLLSSDYDFVHQRSSKELRLTDGKEFLRYTMSMPFTSKTLTATMAEAHAHPELIIDSGGFVFSGPGNLQFNGAVNFWDDPATAREMRKRVRAMVQPSFVEALEILQSSGLFRFADLREYEIITPMILYRTECESGVPELVDELRPPDCSFDDRFGFPCSEKQKARAETLLSAKPPMAKGY